MKFKFDSNLDYQTEAVDAVVDLFKGQNSMHQYFNVSNIFTLYSRQGIGNKIDISNEDILENLRRVQSYHKLAPSETLPSLDFNIEMETGTGKTYVYLKTIFELNKKYNFTKFIIVVPNIAIKEGVNKTLEITKEHFKGLYNNVIYDYFIYDSSKLEQVRKFVVSSNIQIMIINIDAFNKSFKDPSKENKANIIHREQDKLNGYKPIDLIAKTNPVVIIDEPQSVMGGKGEKAVSSLNPLCTLRYSATHKEIQNLIYKLDAVDASEMELVKQIEVASLVSEGQHNKAYVELISTNNKPGSPISAKIKIDANVGGSIKRKTVNVRKGNDLSELSKREIYNSYIVSEISCEEGNEFIKFSPIDEKLIKGQIIGDFDDLTIKRAQIRKTIEEHLDKELRFARAGKKIKVLSLFFIDSVDKYRKYNPDNTWSNGIYADIFEEEYKKLVKKHKYSTLYNYLDLDIDLDLEAHEVHKGYFSQDRKGKNKDKFKETKTGKADADNYAYELIMKDKEKLLSFDTKLKFIFSHSALREGWDNPNVFQICTLNETKSTMKKRQEIGRGLRLCVNQDGERVHDKTVNTLTIMANESYEEFAHNLQKEIADETGIKFGIIEKDAFAHIHRINKKGNKEPLGKQYSQLIFNHFKLKKYVDSKGKIQDALKVAVRDNTVDVPDEYEDIKEEIVKVVEKSTKGLKIQNAATKRRQVKLKESVFDNEEFKLLWDKIKHKTTYSVDYDTDELVSKAIKVMKEKLDIQPPKLIYTKSGLTIESSGVNCDKNGFITSEIYEDEEIALPDIVKYLQNETDLTRRTIVRILKDSETLDQFKINPQEYMQQTAKLINKVLGELIVDGIKYTKTGESYSQELFKNEELFGYLEKNLVKTEHSVYDYIIYDSEVEKCFAERLDHDPEVKFFAKLPRWFKIKTPVGNYNPDWAVMLGEEGEEKMYFVVETKGTIEYLGNRPLESDKIKCGKKHFEALDNDIKFTESDSYENFKKKI